MDLIITDKIGMEQGFLSCDSVDIENGDKNDFEIVIHKENYSKAVHSPDCRIFSPMEEWGGIIKTIHPSGDLLYLEGPTWRGRLDKSIVEPDTGQDYLVVTGDANEVIAQILSRQGLTSLFKAPDTLSGIKVTGYRFPRYYSVLEGLMAMLKSRNGKLSIKYIRGAANEIGYVQVGAEWVRDYSDQVEIGNDMRMDFDIKVNHMITNHLICLGKGNLKDRLVVHLYLDKYGQISDTRYFHGLDEVTDVYESSSEESIDKLKEDGMKKFKELIQSVSSRATLSTDRINVDIGDIVSGRERITGIHVRVPVVRKIYTWKPGRESFEYKLKGE